MLKQGVFENVYLICVARGLCRNVEKVRMHMVPSSLAIGGFCFSGMFADLLGVKGVGVLWL